MKKTNVRKVIALTLATSLVLGGLTPSAKVVAGSGNITDAVDLVLSEDATSIFDSIGEAVGLKSPDEEVTVIVDVDKDSLIDEFLDDKEDDLESFLASDEAQKSQKDIMKAVDKVADRVLNRIEDAELSYTYDTVLTGFAIKTTYGELETIRSIKGVKDVYVAREITVDPLSKEELEDQPTMVTSSEMIGAPSATKEYGVAGEGMVVGVLDTGIWYNHKAFDEANLRGVNVAYNKFSIVSKINNLELASERLFKERYGTSFDANDVYKSLKVPYTFDYVDVDLDTISNDPTDHGTHVSGTIVGNCDEFKGIAYNAQVMMFKVFDDYGGGCVDDVQIAALEDAVKLGVDSINMSLGSDCGVAVDPNSLYQQAFDAVRAAGINLDVAAGNSDSSASGNNYYEYNPTTNPDEATVGNPSTLEAALSVASVENTYLNYVSVFSVVGADGKTVEIGYNDNATLESEKLSSLSAGDYKYVDCGYGYPEEISKVKSKLQGNVALISRGDISFTEKVENAYAGGAVAVIVYDNQPGLINMAIDNYYVPAVSITQANGQAMLAAIDSATGYGVVTLDPEKKASTPNSEGGHMSSFTSYGPTPTLNIKPEITAPGGNIYSALSVEANGESNSGLMSGTSMATPHMTGASTLIRQYYKKLYPTLSKVELMNLVNATAMSTASPIFLPEDDVTYYSPRIQGAGLVNIENAIKAESYLEVTGQERPKAELGYSKTGVFSYEMTIQNMSSKAKDFKLSGVVQAEWTAGSLGNGIYAAAEEDVTLEEATVTFTGANVSADNMITVPARGKATVTVEIALDTTGEEFAMLNMVWPNGFYVEGFVFATPTEADGIELSLPYLGFCGDYTKLPIFDASISDYYDGKALPVWGYGNNLSGYNSAWILGMDVFKYYQHGEMDYDKDKVYTSAYSAYTSNIVPNTYLLAGPSTMTWTYKDAKGKTVKSYSTNAGIRKTFLYQGVYITTAEDWTDMENYPVFDGFDDNGNLLPNGKYTLEVTAKSALGGEPQKYTTSFKVDNTLPKVETYYIENDNYYYVFIHATDNECVEGFELCANDYAYNAMASQCWEPNKNGYMTVRLSKKYLPKEFNPAAMVVYVYDGAFNSTAARVLDKYDLAAPTISKVSTTKTGVKLTYKKVSDADGYKIYRSTSKNGTYTCVGTTSKLSYTDTKNLKKGKTYYYKVVAYAKHAGITEKGAFSAVKSVKFQ